MYPTGNNLLYGKLIIKFCNTLAAEIHIIKCKHGHDNKNCETCGTKYKNCECFLGYTNFKDNLTE